MQNLEHKDVWIRAGKTAVQALVAAILVAPEPLSQSALLAAGAAALSAVWNYLVQASS